MNEELMTENQKKYADWSRPVLWTKNQRRAQKSMFQWRLDEDKQMYYTTRLGIYNGFLGWLGQVMYYIPEEDVFRVVRKHW